MSRRATRRHQPAAGAAGATATDPRRRTRFRRSRLHAATARQVWEAALEQLEDMTADFGRFFASLSVPTPDRLVVRISTGVYSAKAIVRPTGSARRLNRRSLASSAVGEGRVRVDAERSEVVGTATAPASRGPDSRAGEASARATGKTMFDAEIVDVVEPRSDGPDVK